METGNREESTTLTIKDADSKFQSSFKRTVLIKTAQFYNKDVVKKFKKKYVVIYADVLKIKTKNSSSFMKTMVAKGKQAIICGKDVAVICKDQSISMAVAKNIGSHFPRLTIEY